MKKYLSIALAAFALFAGIHTAQAVTCSTAYPSALDNYVSGSCIPSAWANALETKLGVTNSSVTSSLDYLLNNLFTSYQSDIIKATSTQGLLQTLNNLSDLLSTSTARTNLGLGSAATHPSTDFLASTTVVNTPSTTIPTLYLISLNGATGTVTIVGTGSTTVNTSGTVITINSTSTAGGGTGTVSTSTAVTINNIPFWTGDGKLAGTSTLYYATSTGFLSLSSSSTLASSSPIAIYNVPAALTNPTINVAPDGAVNSSSDICFAASRVCFGYNGTNATFQASAGKDIAFYTNGTTLGSGTQVMLIGGGNAYVLGGVQFLAAVPQASSSPQFLIGTNKISAGNASGTALGSNQPSGFNGDFVNLQVNSSTKFKVASSGIPTIPAITNAIILTDNSGNFTGYIATACSAGQAVTGVSATGTLTCNTFATSTAGGAGGIVTSTNGSYALGNVTLFTNSSTVSGNNDFNFVTSTVTLQLGFGTGSNATVISSGTLTLTGSSQISLTTAGAEGLQINSGGDTLTATNGNNITMSGTGTGNFSINITSGSAQNLVLNDGLGAVKFQNNGGNILTWFYGNITASRQITIADATGTLILQSGNFTSGHCVQANGTSTVVDSGSACGSGSGTGTVTTSTAFTANTIPIINGASSIGNSTLTQPGGGVTSVGGVAFLDGGGDFIGPNIFVNASGSVISQNTTGTTAVGNFIQGGGVQTYNTTTTLTGAQFCSGGFIDIINTTGSITITLPTTSTIAASPCGSSVYTGTFSQQFMANNSTNTVFTATNGTGEQQLFSPGTPTSLAPGQEWSITGQFENSSTKQGATSTATLFVAKYQLYTSSTVSNALVSANSVGGFTAYGGSACSGGQAVNGVSATGTVTGCFTPSGGSTATTTVTAAWTVGGSGASFTTIQGALDACGTAGGGNIYLKPGTYAQGGTGLLWKGSNCVIYGAAGTSTITFTGAISGFATASSGAQYNHNELHNVTITMDGNTSGAAVDESNMSHNIYDDLTISNVGTCVKIHDTVDITFYNKTANVDCTSIVKFGIDGSSTEPWNANEFDNNFWGCGTANCIGELIGNSEHNNFYGDRIEPNGAPLSGTIGIKIFDSNVGTNPGNFGNSWYNPYLEGNATAIQAIAGASCGSGECIAGDTFYGGISDVNGTLTLPTSTGISFINFNNNFTPETTLVSHFGITGQTVAPTISAGATLDQRANDSVGTFNITAAATSKTLTFAIAYPIAPICQAQVASGTGLLFNSKAAAASVVFTATASIPTTTIVSYICIGNNSQN